MTVEYMQENTQYVGLLFFVTTAKLNAFSIASDGAEIKTV